MKLLIPFLCIFVIQTAFAQNYIPFNPHKPAFYSYQSGLHLAKNVATAYYDSSWISGSDSVFRSALQLPEGWKDDVFGSRGRVWHLSFMSVNPSGEVILFDSFPARHEIRINILAEIGNKWSYQNVDSVSFFEAEVIGKSLKTFNGIADSVKTIQLNCRDFSGNLVNNNLNGTILELSKEYGFVTFYDLFLAHTNPWIRPYAITEYKPLTRGAVYGYEIGDEFSDLLGCKNNYKEKYTHYKVIGKTPIAGGYSYTVKRRTEAVNIFWAINSSDTIQLDITDTSKQIVEGLPEIATIVNGELLSGFTHQIPDVDFTKVYRVLDQRALVLSNPRGFEWNMIFDDRRQEYTAGLGYTYFPTIANGINCDASGFEKRVCYYKVNGSTASQRCWPWEVGTRPEFAGPALNLFPNPSQHTLTLSIGDGTSGTMQIHSVNGGLLKQYKINPGTTEHSINIEDLPPGIYLLTLSCESRVLKGRFVKIP